ncbi:MAG: ankyrin repeat domain-containing protein [Rickettsiaceae bacterium]|nr:MAG: ankyrin repeat domain-containing protein [Rickettsiaceae bacterium]
MSMNSVVNVNTQDIEGKAPLHYAVEGVGKNTVKILLTQTTVDVDIQDLKSRTPLNDVTRGYYEERAKTLPADGSDAVNNISLTSK